MCSNKDSVVKVKQRFSSTPVELPTPEGIPVTLPTEREEQRTQEVCYGEDLGLEMDEEDLYKDIPGSVAGNIHKAEYDKFWAEELKPDLWTARVRTEGYELTFKNNAWPPPYEEPNNQSCKDNMEFAWQQMLDWEGKGVVRRPKQKPRCVSPLTVSSRKMEEEEIKRRLCLDLSRHINKLLKKEVVRLSNLDKALQVLLRNDVQATYDLVSAYHHVAIHPDHQELLGCALPDPITGETVYFEFTCMPFGLATATHCLTRLT